MPTGPVDNLVGSRPTLTPLAGLGGEVGREVNTPFGAIAERAQWLLSVEAKLRETLPESLSAHLRVLNIRGTELVLGAQSPAWRQHVRLQAVPIVAAARALGLDIASVTVRLSFPDRALSAVSTRRDVSPVVASTLAHIGTLFEGE